MIELVQKITNYIDSLSTKKRYLFIGIFIGALFALHAMIIFWHYSTIQHLKNQIDEINEQREERVQDIVTRTNHVRKQREEVDALLAKDPDFKLGGYINDLLAELRLTNNKESETTSQTEREEKYLETILTMKLVDLNTQQLTELLEKMENNPRITINSLEIAKSKKKPDTIEALFTLATLQPKEF